MAAPNRATPAPLAGSPELLGRADRPVSGAPGRRRTVAGVLLVAALALATLLVEPTARATTGELRVLEVGFGQPFEVEWSALEPTGSTEVADGQPLPMTSPSPPCVGFGRPDWPEERRQPSVAHCANAATVDGLGPGVVGLVRVVPVGDETWYVLRFGRPPTELVVSPLLGDAIPPLFAEGPDAAILLPTASSGVRLRWREGDGRTYRCDLDRSGPSPVGCG